MDNLSTDTGNNNLTDALGDLLTLQVNGQHVLNVIGEVAVKHGVDTAGLYTVYLNHMKAVERARLRVLVGETVELVMAISTSLQKYPR